MNHYNYYQYYSLIVAPEPPDGVTVTVVPDGLHVTWSATPTTKGYIVVYSSNAGNDTQQVSTNTTTISPAVSNSIYSINIHGYYDLLSNESENVKINYGGTVLNIMYI